MVVAKLKLMLTPKKCLAAAGLAVLVVLGGAQPLLAQQTVAQSYGSDTVLQRGMIVGLKKDKPEDVVPINTDSTETVHGVVIDANETPVTLTQEGQQVFVTNVGQYETLVSTQNGVIAVGDLISISAISGVGMKANEKVEYILGKAVSSFDGKEGVIGTKTLKDGAGLEYDVGFGRIKVDISITKNPLIKKKEPDLPKFLQRAVENIAHKPVSTIRLYTSFAVLIATTILAITLIYGGVRSSVYALGRNPLSRKSIVRGMIQVIIVGIMIFISGIFGVYLLLRL